MNFRVRWIVLVRLLTICFEDSKISKKMACGNSKAELIVKEVLGPFLGVGDAIVKIIKLKIKSVALRLQRTKNDIICLFVSNANPLHYYALQVPRKVDRWR